MPYDKDIEQNIEAIYAAEEGLTSKHMFGGVCYLYRGNMAFGVYKDNVIVRLGSHKEAKRQIDSGRALPFDITGKAMKGWIMIPKAQLSTPQDYRQWLDRGLRVAKSLPPK